MKVLKASLIIFSLLFIAWAAGFGWFALKTTSLHPYDLQQRADAIVVLTGGEGRLDEGLNLFSAQRGLYLYISGVFDKLSEDDVRRRWKGKSELPICCIILDPMAKTTAQNALMTRAWVDSFAQDPSQSQIHSIRLVTSNYHMLRALIDFDRILPDVQIYPHPIISPNAHMRDQLYWVLLLKEYHKYLFRVVQATLSDKWQEVMA